MTTINKNVSPTVDEIKEFLKEANFNLPKGFIDFYKESNGVEISSDEKYVFLWTLSNMLKLNKEYNVSTYAPEFFIFGSDGGDTAYAVEKNTGNIYEIPFVGMSKEEAIYISDKFSDFIGSIIG